MPFLPLGDSTPRLRIERPYVSWTLIALCSLIFLVQNGMPRYEDAELIYGLGVIPAVLTGSAQLSEGLELLPAWATLVSYQFLHGGWDHLLGNMLFLWVFADNVEDCLGHLRFLIFYLLCGVAAALLHVAADAGAAVPLIGASGAISGVLGAYLVLHPFSRLVVILFFIPLVLPAWVLLAGWFAFQFFSAQSDASPVAWWAHIGGFAVGALLVPFFRQSGVPLFASSPPRRITLRVPRTRSGAAGHGATGEAPTEGGRGPWEKGPWEKGPWEMGPSERGPWERDGRDER